eukprot:2110469-Pyramimonas_sp.AAC.1
MYAHVVIVVLRCACLSADTTLALPGLKPRRAPVARVALACVCPCTPRSERARSLLPPALGFLPFSYIAAYFAS